VLNFYQINRDGEIQNRDRLVIKTLIPCQGTISTQWLKLLDEVSGYNLYYSLIYMTIASIFVEVEEGYDVERLYLLRTVNYFLQFYQ
jgi:hypothetical protein